MSVINVPMDATTFGWLQISFWAFSAAVIAAIVFFAYHIIDQFRTPDISKRTRDSHRQKKAGLILAGDDGYADFEIAKYTGSEGWAETKEKGKPKWNFIGFFPRPGKISEDTPVDESGGKDLSKTRQWAEYINFLNTRKIQFRGSNNPIWIAVKPKAILMNLKALAAIQLTEAAEKEWTRFTDKPFPIDISAMKQMVVSSSYNQSQVIALSKVHEKIGEEKRPATEAYGKWFFIIAIVMLVAGVCALGAAAFLK
jgi:hypothetical protein